MVSQTIIIGLCFLFAMMMPFSQAQFGLPKKDKNKAAASSTATVDANGEVQTNGDPATKVSPALVRLLTKAEQQAGGTLQISADDALNIDGLLQQALQDPQTQVLVQEMKTMQREVLEQMLGETTPLQVVTTLKSVMDELISLEILFQDPKRALVEMEKEGMVEKERLPEYKKNPELLEEDTRKALYMTFVSTAVVGELM